MIDVNMLDAVKVQFLKPIFEGDFVERGMKAWLTKIVKKEDMYELFFDFTEFEEENLQYFTETFYPNIHTGTDKALYTAIEAQCYYPEYSVYFNTSDRGTNDLTFSDDIAEYIKEI